jgi:hypothetical protein
VPYAYAAWLESSHPYEAAQQADERRKFVEIELGRNIRLSRA